MARIIFYFYILLLCVYSVYSESPPIGNLPPQQNRKIKDAEDSLGTKDDGKGQEKQIIPEINVNIGKRNDNNTDGTKKSENNTNGGKSDDKKDKTISSNSSTTKTLVNSNIKTNTNTEIESGAVMRGIFVFVGITMICIMYIGFKTYFKSNKKSPLIRKYGVKTRRSDIEMEPLPLEEDEEDETVFDLSNINNR